MSPEKPPVDEQMQVLMRGVEYGDPNIQKTMEEELRARLATGEPLRVYAGFDPTAVDLTLGHIVPMMKLRQFQDLGHEVYFLMGTMTATIGDPTDKSAARQRLTIEEVSANAESWVSQAYRVLDPARTKVVRNGNWLAQLGLTDLVEIASSFTVQQFLDHETFRNRIAAGRPLYIHEFIYALMQAYDAYHLKADVQVGGIDQLFNIMAGRTLQRAKGNKPLVAVTTPLLVGTDGNIKMSKSVGNYIGLDEAPDQMYGKVMSIPDTLILNYYTLLVPDADVPAIERAMADRTLHPMDAKKRLAHAIVALLNDEAAADAAQAEFERVFQQGSEPEEAIEVPLDDLVLSERDSPPELIPWPALPFGTLIVGGMSLRDYVLAKGVPVLLATFVSQFGNVSMSEARRLVQQGAVSIDGSPVTKAVANVRPGSLIRIGRHRFFKLGQPRNWPS